MSPVAIKTAARVGFPADHIIGDIWTGSEEDVRPAGAAAKGYLAVSVFPPGTEFKISQTLKKEIVDAGKSDLKDPSKFGSVYYNAGLVTAIVYVEALRTGHKKFGNRPLTAAEGQWALEHLDITPQRIDELGATGLLSPLKVTSADHEGSPAAKIQQWDGTAWHAADGLAERRPGAVPRCHLRQGGRLRQGEEPPGRATPRPTEEAGDGRPRADSASDVDVASRPIYGDAILALRGVSFSVPQGAIVALLGANGAGKSTTLKAISNLLGASRGRVSKGTITWRGEATAGSTRADLVRRGIVQVLEGRHCFSQLTVEENLLSGGFARRPGRRETQGGSRAHLRALPAPEATATREGGPALGRGTADGRHRPRADEPADPDAARRAVDGARAHDRRGDLRDHRRLNADEGVTFMLAEQNAHLVLRYAHHGVVLENGRVAVAAPAAELLARDDVSDFYLGGGATARRSTERSSGTGYP